MVQKWNDEIMRKFEKGDIHAAAAIEGYLPPPRPVEAPSLAWVRKWKSSWGWSMLTRSADESTWLPYNHVDMQQSRARTAQMIAEGVHRFLILNYDQLWRNSWCMSKHKIAWKDRQAVGTRARKCPAGARQDKKIHAVRGSRRSMTATWPSQKEHGLKHVQYCIWFLLQVLTTSWSDGTPGPIAFCVPEGKMPSAEIQKWNREHVGRSLIITSQTPTHFMNGEILVVIMEQLFSPALEAQRARQPVREASIRCASVLRYCYCSSFAVTVVAMNSGMA